MLKIEKKYNPKKEIEIIPVLQERKIKKPDFSILTPPIKLSEKIKYVDVISQIRADVFYKYFSLRGDLVSGLSIWWVTLHHWDLISDKKPSNINNLIWSFSKNREYASKKLKRLWISGSEISQINIWEKNSHTIRNLFSSYCEKGIFFEEECINYRSINRQSIVSNEEINFKPIKKKKYKIKYFVDTKKECLTISTFSPETIFADVALAVNPVDRRYKKLIGSKVIIPIINKTIPIVGDESVDMQIDSWVVRVTPSHDKFWLDIALKHKLNTNKSAIDRLGMFTSEAWDFAGKKMSDFRDNVIQYLDDICNLWETQDMQTDIAIHKETWEELLQVMSKQWFVKPTQDNIQSLIEDEYITSLNYKKSLFDDEISKVTQICISNNQPFWVSMPLRLDKEFKSYTIDDNVILQNYKKNWKSKKILLTLIIFNLYMDSRVNKRFWLEEIIDILISPSIISSQNIIETYLDTYRDLAKSSNFSKSFCSEIDELADIIKHSDKNNVDHLDILTNNIIKYLEKSYLINDFKDQEYLLDIRSIFSKDIEKQNLTFDQNIVNSILFLNALWYLSEKPIKKRSNLFIVPNDQIINTIKTILLCKQLQPAFSFKYIFSLDPMDYKEKNKIWFWKKSFIDISDITESSWWDVSRLLLLFSQNNKITEDDILLYQNFINKLRNATRFLVVQGEPGKRKRHFDKIQKEAEKSLDISLYDQRIIHKLKDFYQDYQDMFSTLEMSDILPKLENLIKSDFCEKYIEMQKIKKSKNVEIYGFFIIGLICKLIYPFMPFISQTIWEMCLFQWNVQDDLFVPFFSNSEKNYKTQLIVDIIDKIIHIKEKKNRDRNSQINVCISTSTDLIDYISRHESIIKKITSTQGLEYKKNLPIDNLGYEIDSMINITIWVKVQEQQNKIEEKSISNLQEELSLCNQEIQKLRSIISTLSQSNDHDSQIQIEDKKKEIIKIKKKSERLELEILTMKSKN